MAVDAVFGVEPPAARRGRFIDRRAIGGPTLSRERDRQQDGGDDPDERAAGPESHNQRHMAGFALTMYRR